MRSICTSYMSSRAETVRLRSSFSCFVCVFEVGSAHFMLLAVGLGFVNFTLPILICFGFWGFVPVPGGVQGVSCGGVHKARTQSIHMALTPPPNQADIRLFSGPNSHVGTPKPPSKHP